MQLFMPLSLYAFDLDLPRSLPPTRRCGSRQAPCSLQHGRGGSGGLAGRSRARPAPAGSVPFPGERQGHGHTPCGALGSSPASLAELASNRNTQRARDVLSVRSRLPCQDPSSWQRASCGKGGQNPSGKELRRARHPEFARQ